MKMRSWMVVTILGAALTARAVTNELTGLLQQGLFEEEANRNLDAAISNYQTLANSFDKDRQVAATAIFRLGECYRKLDRTNEAAAQYQRIIREFGDQQTLVTLSRQNLTGMGIAQNSSETFTERVRRMVKEAGKEAGEHSNDESSVASDSLQQMRDALTREQLEYTKKESTLRMLKSMNREDLKKALPTVTSDSRLNSLIAELDLAEQKLNDLKLVYSPDNPNYKNAQALVNDLQRKIDDRVDGIMTGLQAQLGASKAYMDSIKKEIATLQSSNSQLAANEQSGNERAPMTDDEEKEIRRIQELIQNSPDLINAPNTGNNESTPLYNAAQMNWLRVATFLLDHGAKVEIESHGETPLVEAARNANKGMVELLLSRGADVNARSESTSYYDLHGQTALHIAAGKGFLAVAETLLNHKADVNARDRSQRTPLYLASGNGRAELIKLLLAHGADVNARDERDNTPLYQAVASKSPEAVNAVLTAKPELNLANKDGRTALSAAAVNGNMDIINELLAAKADPNAGTWNMPLVGAVAFDNSSDRTNLSALLLQAGADPNKLAFVALGGWNNAPYSPMQIAVALGQTGIIKLLLDHGGIANTNIGAGTQSLLMMAAGHADADAAKALLAHGADPNARGTGDYTPLHWALGFGNLNDWDAKTDRLDVVKLLLDNHANPNVQDNSGETPLDWLKKRIGSPLGKTSGQLYDKQVFAQQLADLLRANGALDNLPDFNAIRIARDGTANSTVVFGRSSNDWTQATLFDVLGLQYRLITTYQGIVNRSWVNNYDNTSHDNSLKFPDLARVVIHRPVAGGASTKELKIDVAHSLDSGNCAADVPLQFGDVVEVPEADHVMDAPWMGLATNELVNLGKCLTRNLQITVKGQTTNIALAPRITINRSPFPQMQMPLQLGGRRESAGPTDIVDLYEYQPFMIWPALRDSNLLLASSDLSRIKVTRHDTATGKTHEWTVDCSKPQSPPDFWLRDGDVIEVPEKPGE